MEPKSERPFRIKVDKTNMGKIICLLVVFLILLCGCSQKQQADQGNHLTIGNFSYEEVFNYYKDDPGLYQSGFVNTEKADISNPEQVIELANKECTVDYDTVSIAFDATSMMYRVSFYKMDWDGGNQEVYINQDGITQLIFYGE